MTTWKPLSDMWLEIEAKAATPVRSSATQFTVSITATWKTYYDSNKTLWGVTAESGGKTSTLNPFGTKSSGSSKTFTGTYSISGNGSATKSITVTFKYFNSDTGKSYSKNLSISVNVPAWTSYSIKYNANGGTGAPGTQTKWKDQKLTLSTTKPTRTGYGFKNWNTASGGTGTSYASGASYTANSAATLYAQWTANSYTVTYNANGGTGAPSSQTKTYGVNLTLSNTKPTRSGYNFKGWGTSASATTVAYNPGATYTANAALTLYAIWEIGYVKPRISNIQVHRASMKASGGFVWDDEGTMLVLDFDWSTDISNPSYTVSWKKSSDSWDGADSETYSLGGTSGAGVVYYTGSDVEFSVETSYDIRLTVTDSSGSTTVETVLPSMIMAVDVCPAQITYLHLATTTAGSNSNRIYYDTSKFSHEMSTEYTISFSARTSVADTVLVTCVAGSQNVKEYTLSTDWEIYTYTYTASVGGSVTIYIKTADTDADIMNLEIVKTGDSYSRLAEDATSNTSYWVKDTSSVHTISVETDNEGVGVAIGKTAETHGLFDVDLASRFRKHAHVGNKTGYQDGNTGIFLSSEGFIHLQRATDKGYHPYIGFYIGDSKTIAGQIRCNCETEYMEFVNAEGYIFDQEVHHGSYMTVGDKRWYNDANQGWYFGADGTAHVSNGAGGQIYFHYDHSSSATSSIQETGSGVLTLKAGVPTLNATDKLNFIVNGKSYKPYYTAGDTISVTVQTAGYVTDAKRAINFEVPLSKPVIGVSSVTAASGTGFCLRQGNTYTHGSAASTNVTPNGYSYVNASNETVKVAAYVASIHAGSIRITAGFSNTTNAINNDSIGIYWNGTITFS